MGEARPRVLLIATQDTKQEETRFVRRILEEAGIRVIHLDPSVRQSLGGAEISPEEVARAAGTTIEAVRSLGHEGKCHDLMVTGALARALETHARAPLAGVFAIGGSMGTGLATAVMRALPYGLPKLMVSTMASGFTRPYVGVKDIAMLHAVTDISGLNSISRDVLRNGALAMAGMAKGYRGPRSSRQPLVLATTLGTTEASVRRIRKALEADGAEVMVFHSSGAGGTALDSIAAERDVALVLELSVTEIVDELFGGIAAAGPERGMAALRRGIPTILAPGNADFVIGGPLEVAAAQFPGRRYHVHSPALTAVRTQLAELKRIAEKLADMAAQARGPVEFLVPLRGFSRNDGPDGHLHDPSLPGPFADHLEQALAGRAPLTRVDAHFNDPDFSDAVLARARKLMGAPA
ncbi:MAG: Tm-1-like ATP-binding domain-containing protein [Sphingomonadaceae bacterium]